MLFANELTIACRRPALLDALAAVAAVVPLRSPKEVLKMVRFVADPAGDDGGVAWLEATDLEVAVHHRILGADVVTDRVDVLLPADRVGKLLRVAEETPGDEPPAEAETEGAARPRRKGKARTGDDDTIAITPGAGNVTLAGRKWKAVLPTEDPAQFPPLPRFEATNYLAVAAADLARAIRRTLFACDPLSQRYALGGCLFTPGAGTLTVIGTDCRRIAEQTVPAEPEGSGWDGVADQAIVPVKALKLLLGLLDDADPPVHLAVAASTLLVRTASATVSARLLHGRFPSYRNAFPTAPATVATVGCGELVDGCARALVTTSDLSRGVDFAFGAGSLTLSAQAADVGAGTGELAATLLAGPPLTLTLDARYVVEMLKTLDRAAPLRIELVDPETGVTFRTPDGYAYVVSTLTRPQAETGAQSSN